MKHIITESALRRKIYNAIMEATGIDPNAGETPEKKRKEAIKLGHYNQEGEYILNLDAFYLPIITISDIKLDRLGKDFIDEFSQIFSGKRSLGNKIHGTDDKLSAKLNQYTDEKGREKAAITGYDKQYSREDACDILYLTSGKDSNDSLYITLIPAVSEEYTDDEDMMASTEQLEARSVGVKIKNIIYNIYSTIRIQFEKDKTDASGNVAKKGRGWRVYYDTVDRALTCDSKLASVNEILSMISNPNEVDKFKNNFMGLYGIDIDECVNPLDERQIKLYNVCSSLCEHYGGEKNSRVAFPEFSYIWEGEYAEMMAEQAKKEIEQKYGNGVSIDDIKVDRIKNRTEGPKTYKISGEQREEYEVPDPKHPGKTITKYRIVPGTGTRHDVDTNHYTESVYATLTGRIQ